MDRVSFVTTDGVKIIGNFFLGKNKKFVLLLHMMPATKESWGDFAIKLNRDGYSVLAFDQRGHGESIENGQLNYLTFEDAAQQAKSLDLEAAFNWLKQFGATEKNTVLVGASIGANLALRFTAEHNKIKKVVALSPGLDYRGVTTEDALELFKVNQQAFLVATQEDKRSADSVTVLSDKFGDNTKELILSGQAHGTDIFKENSKLEAEILEFLNN